MAAATQVMKQKRSCEDDENVEETQKVKKKRKVAENDIWENQQKAKILSEKKKPHLSAAVFGEDCEISYDQLYQFLKYAALGKRHDAAQPSWCRIHHRRRLAGVAVVVLCGVSQLHFDRFYMQFKNLRKTFKHRFCLPPSSDGFMEKLCGAGINDNPQISRQVTQKDPIIQKYGEERHGLSSYSGITEELLLPVTTTLADVQVQLKKLLPAHAVLVGHSLNFDLRALEMVHPNVIDTSLLFARKGGKRFKLKFLAKAVLGKQIQPTDGKGHDPTEDAKCALELAQYFINQGPRKVAELNLEARLQQERETGNRQNCPLPHQENGVRKPTQSLLDILCSVGQKTFFLGGQSEAASYNCQNHISSLNKQVLQRALEEIPRSSFSVIQLCLGLQQDTPHQVAETVSKMRTKLANMLTVYAGPFGKDACLKSLKRTFKKYGHVLSISAIAETCEPHICVQYEVLEAAQLAMESLNGEEVAGSLIKLQRPITEVTLDCEMLVKELERDADNEGVLYLSGLGKTQSETDLREKLGYLKDLNAVFVPRDPRTGKRRNYCFLKFQTPESVRRALKTIEEERDRGSKLQSRMALTPARLHKWFCHVTQNGGKLAVSQPLLKAPFPEKKKTFALEQDLKKAMKAFDHRIKKLYQGLPDHMLCVILLPGTNSSVSTRSYIICLAVCYLTVSESLHGFGLLGIKGDNPPLEAPNCNHSF
ncbi:RNA exonuclease 5 isoform X5 [Rhineura floridana]|uniref:RNA exonuclease 5 isoform X5 n=1 Tax=Rhineura floridana TaxID=261503 RepID=UPI002AC83113|nr:RNA exonuclease 5 isoform X5 [Rhineura floridana]